MLRKGPEILLVLKELLGAILDFQLHFKKLEWC